MRSDLLINGRELIAIRKTNPNVSVFKPEVRIDIRCDCAVGLENIFYVYIDEVVEGIYVLLHKTLDFEKCRQQKPLVLKGGIGKNYLGGMVLLLSYLNALYGIGETKAIPIRLVVIFPSVG